VRTIYPHHSASSSDLMTAGPAGGGRQLLTGDSVPGGLARVGQIAWSPNGQMLVLAASSAGQGSPVNQESMDLYLIAPDGTGLRQVTSLGDAFYPVFSADGGTLYFSRFGGKSPRTLHGSIWAIGVDGSGLRQLTPDRVLVFDFPASVSPVGDELAFTRARCNQKLRCGENARGFSLSTGAEWLIAKRADEPIYSPDGTRIALASFRDRNGVIRISEEDSLPASELYVLNTATRHMRRLTRTMDVIEGAASWDPSGQRIAFAREGSSFSSRILETNADGSCKVLLFRKQIQRHHRLEIDYATPIWQPGPGREAGRIAC
jgi:Tol biopolymer transport system component